MALLYLDRSPLNFFLLSHIKFSAFLFEHIQNSIAIHPFQLSASHQQFANMSMTNLIANGVASSQELAEISTPEPIELAIKAEVKAEANEDVPVATATPKASKAAREPKTPKTPKMPRSPKTPRSNKRAADVGVDEEDAEGTPSKKAKASGKAIGGSKIATSIAELSTVDRLLLSMKDSGKTWSEINEAWKAATGETPGKSTLPNRYARLKANITQMKAEDQEKLMIAFKKVHDRFEREKWELVRKAMEEAGAESYNTTILQKQHKKLSENTAASAVAAATVASAGSSPADEAA
ncbi:hypothetical protein K432DRAFT_443679 [Lepidopterella palustris CBS 459.81]|uniref:Myb-like domain-containing protein n=1 Tax=Lepidopterella palustris CBS 459.81 TaxID=1314670 RepID=A0A8E2JEI7_9PEZI|nr:hypothetical protein K432DRAFT_443679 [Lepidopterella palustris CBS 459.81]